MTHWLVALCALLTMWMTGLFPAAAGASPQGPAAPPVRTATTHPMKYHISLPRDWSANRTWPVLVAPSAHYGDKAIHLLGT